MQSQFQPRRALAFARSHDWGTRAFVNKAGALVVPAAYGIAEAIFTSMSALRDWAGY